MELSTFSFIIGAVEFLMAIPLLFATKHTIKWIKKFMQDDSLTRIVGAFLAILSFLVLTEGTNIGSSPEGLMRLVAWIVLIKGLMLCWWPDWLVDIQKRFLANTEFMIFGAVLMLIFGFLFIIAGTMV